jgi:hypothetical protein
VRVRLTRKLADRIDGIDLKRYHVGDVLELPPADAQLLVAEAWALVERRRHNRAATGATPRRRSNDRPASARPRRHRGGHIVVRPRRPDE